MPSCDPTEDPAEGKGRSDEVYGINAELLGRMIAEAGQAAGITMEGAGEEEEEGE